jgi:DNA primase
MGTVDEVRERLPIEQVVGKIVALKKAGTTYKGLCPFHTEKTPSFIVTPSRGRYHCFGCLPPGSLIKTQRGMRPIEKIQVGDLVYAGDGRLHPVLFTHEHAFSGELVRLTCAPFKAPILLTPNHKVPVFRPMSRRTVEIEAGEIHPHTYLLYPAIARHSEPLSWSTCPEWEAAYGPRPRSLPPTANIDTFAEWLGWYLAEGSVSNDRTVRFSLSHDELHHAHRLRDLSAGLFGCDMQIACIGTKVEGWFCHALLSRWLKHHCGAGAHGKHLPDFVWTWNSKQQWTLFHALMLADGSMRRGTTLLRGYEVQKRWRLGLASPTLIDDIRDLLLLNGITPSLAKSLARDGRVSWHLYIRQDAGEVWGKSSPSSCTPVRVRAVTRVPYEGPVYNLTVAEEHTYLTMSGTVCNCGADGDIFNFIMATQNLDFGSALRQLAAEAGVTVEDPRETRSAETRTTRIYEMNATAATYFQAMLMAAPGAAARGYLHRRHITDATIDRFGLGFAPDARNGLCMHLRKSGYTDDELVAAGLAIVAEEGGPMRDRFRGRLIFPIRDAKGRILGFGGRVLGAGEPKYLNSPATPVFDKSRVLYTIEHAADAIRSAREAVVVEGYVDALRAHQEGFSNVVATLGTAVTEHQLRALARLAPRLVLALDADPAGQKAAARAGLAALSALSVGNARASQPLPTATGMRRDAVQVYVATLPAGQDPDDAIATDPTAWRRAIADAVPLMDHYFTLVEAGLDRTRPEWRQEAIDTLIPAIGQLEGLGVQQAYIERLADLTGIDARYLRDLTPGGALQHAPLGRETRGRGGAAAIQGSPPPVADPVREPEKYLAGVLLLHRPLPPDVRAELATFTPLTPELAPLFAALAGGQEPAPAEEDLAERLADEAAQRPAIPPAQLLDLLGEVRLRVEGERVKRELLHYGHVLPELDPQTAREMDPRVLAAMALKEQLAVRFQKEQAQHRCQPAGSADDADSDRR